MSASPLLGPSLFLSHSALVFANGSQALPFFQAEFVMNEVRGAGQWHLSVPLAAVLGTWEVLRLAAHGREWTRAVAVAPPMSHGLVHMWLRSADGRFRCLLSGDGEVRAGQRARTAGSVKTATSPGR